jgi:hypothetical protein
LVSRYFSTKYSHGFEPRGTAQFAQLMRQLIDDGQTDLDSFCLHYSWIVNADFFLHRDIVLDPQTKVFRYEDFLYDKRKLIDGICYWFGLPLSQEQLNAVASAHESIFADDSQGEAHQVRREGRQAWPLRRLPDGRGRHSEKLVRRHPAVDRGTAATTCYIDRVRRSIVMSSLQTMGEVRRDDGKRNIFWRSARNWPAPTSVQNAHGTSGLPKMPIRRSLGWRSRLSGECRIE